MLRSSGRKKAKYEKKVPPYIGPVALNAKSHDTQEQLTLETHGFKQKEEQSKLSSLSQLSEKALYHGTHTHKVKNLPIPRKPRLVLGQHKILRKFIHDIEAQQPKPKPENQHHIEIPLGSDKHKKVPLTQSTYILLSTHFVLYEPSTQARNLYFTI